MGSGGLPLTLKRGGKGIDKGRGWIHGLMGCERG